MITTKSLHARRIARLATGLVWAFGVLVAPVAPAAADESAPAGMSPEERAALIPTGPWQGTWRITRQDTRLRTLGAQELLTMTVWQDRNALAASADWSAGRAICLNPLASPCEWVGAQGQAATAAAHGAGLVVVLPVSADDSDPFVVSLFGPPSKGRTTGLEGIMVSAKGELRYRVHAVRIDPR